MRAEMCLHVQVWNSVLRQLCLLYGLNVNRPVLLSILLCQFISLECYRRTYLKWPQTACRTAKLSENRHHHHHRHHRRHHIVYTGVCPCVCLRVFSAQTWKTNIKKLIYETWSECILCRTVEVIKFWRYWPSPIWKLNLMAADMSVLPYDTD